MNSIVFAFNFEHRIDIYWCAGGAHAPILIKICAANTDANGHLGGVQNKKSRLTEFVRKLTKKKHQIYYK